MGRPVLAVTAGSAVSTLVDDLGGVGRTVTGLCVAAVAAPSVEERADADSDECGHAGAGRRPGGATPLPTPAGTDLATR